MTVLLLFLLSFHCGPARTQNYGADDLKGFTRSPTEHIINRIDEPFAVRVVKGEVQFRNGPLENVLIEIQGPGTGKTIRRAHTDRRGQFEIKNVPNGAYKFKATLAGFQSTVGTISVSSRASRVSLVHIEMHIGT